MRLWVGALALLFIGVLAFVLFQNRAPIPALAAIPDTNSAEERPLGVSTRMTTQTGRPAALQAPPAADEALASSPSSNSLPPLAVAPMEVPPTPESASLPPQIILENMRRVIRQYGDMFGGNPVGTNLEITRALQGNNPKQINFLKPDDGNRVNANGELVDAWGTPYFFHQLSATDMEIRSAGPDRKMWSDDDLVTR
jgi:hypothetical protein